MVREFHHSEMVFHDESFIDDVCSQIKSFWTFLWLTVTSRCSPSSSPSSVHICCSFLLWSSVYFPFRGRSTCPVSVLSSLFKHLCCVSVFSEWMLVLQINVIGSRLIPGFDFSKNVLVAVFLMRFLCLLKRRKKLCSLLNLCLSVCLATICQLLSVWWLTSSVTFITYTHFFQLRLFIVGTNLQT